MKKIILSLIAVLVLILLASCTIKNDTSTVKEGTYEMEHETSEVPISPQLTISEDRISFSYDLLSSYFPVGSYTIENPRLTMMTDDKLYQYTFEINGDSLVFLQNESSAVKLLNKRMGIAITDQAVFTLKDQ